MMVLPAGGGDDAFFSKAVKISIGLVGGLPREMELANVAE